MNSASNDQLIAVAQSCSYFDGGVKTSSFSTYDEEISCEVCHHWDGQRCTIDVFDNVLTSMDQT